MKPMGGGLLPDAKLALRYLLQFDGVVPDPGIQDVVADAPQDPGPADTADPGLPEDPGGGEIPESDLPVDEGPGDPGPGCVDPDGDGRGPNCEAGADCAPDDPLRYATVQLHPDGDDDGFGAGDAAFLAHGLLFRRRGGLEGAVDEAALVDGELLVADVAGDRGAAVDLDRFAGVQRAGDMAADDDIGAGDGAGDAAGAVDHGRAVAVAQAGDVADHLALHAQVAGKDDIALDAHAGADDGDRAVGRLPFTTFLSEHWLIPRRVRRRRRETASADRAVSSA